MKVITRYSCGNSKNRGSVRAFLVEQSQKTASTFAKRAVGGEHIAWIIGSLGRSNRQYYGHIDSTGLHLQ